jgi:hypothetical protein
MQPKDCFRAAGGFPAKLKKISCSEGIWVGVSDFAAIRCISGAESRTINGLVLIVFTPARARARVMTTGGNEWPPSREGGSGWKSGLASSPPTVTAG